MNISDSELRERLIARGFNPPPVTDSSRDVLIKKLKKLETSTLPATTNRCKNTMNTSDSELRECLIARGFDPPPVTDSNRDVLVKKLKKLEASALPATNSHNSHNDTDHETKILSRARQSEKNYEPNSDKYDNFRIHEPSRQTKSSRKDTERVDSVIKKVKTSTPYDHVYSRGDPFERGSDSDDSISSSKPSHRPSLQGRKPLGSRRESEYYTAPYKRYDMNNGASSYLNRGINRSRSSYKGSKWTNFTSWFSFQSFTPTFVLVVCLLFFVIVAGIYYSKNDHLFGELSIDGTNEPKCSIRGRQGISCIPDKEIEDSLTHVKSLYRSLWKKETNSVCGRNSGSMKAIVSEKELLENLAVESGLLRHEAEKAAKNLKILVNANPQFKIVWSDEEMGFKMENVELPWSCTMKILFSVFLSYSFYVMATVALLFSMHILLRWVVNRHQEHNMGTQDLVKGILEILQQNAISNPSQNYLPIVHVRDQLISFADRERKKKMWANAIKYIEENESRIRKEVQPFQGEDYDVWRWLGGNQLPALKPKTWQGEAFETSKDTMNTPSTSPTPCLKIRHMFDPKNETSDEDWGTEVKDAILERCEGVNIIHLAVDEMSPEGCVYMKCASTDDAGKAYRKIHGAWYDGKIVTVKYLRLERYHERFPASVGLTKPLLPSNDQKRSLA